MNHWDLLRKEARRRHAEVCAQGDDKCDRGAPAEILLAKAEKMTGIRRRALPKDHPLLDGAVAKLERSTIWYDSSVEHWLSLYYQAHEFAHHWLRHGARACTRSDIDSEASEDKVPLGVHRVQGYGPHERNETDANLFAREFLLAGDVLKGWFTEAGLNAGQIAARVGVSVEMVCHQLARSLLTPDVPPDGVKAESPQDDFDLDESQRAAAHLGQP